MVDGNPVPGLQMRYQCAIHAVQTGVAAVSEHDATEISKKHLRVGINSAMIEHAALASRLIKKGIITECEYWEALVEHAEREARSYERRLFDITGEQVRLL